MKELHAFDHFPTEDPCPICGSKEDGKTVLVEIDGTGDGNICEAVPVHLACAVVTNYNQTARVMYLRTRGGE
jgi:hypothetical protein